VVYFGEELGAFGYVMGVFLPHKLKLIWINSELVSKRK
jgi:hypothetical protein